MRSRLCGVLALLAATVLAVPVRAADLYWFGNGTDLGGSGNWSAAGMNWSTTTPAPTLTAWNPADSAVFQGSTGTVTVTDPNIDAGAGMSFETDPYTVTGGSVTLTGASSAANSIDVSAAVTATSNAVIAGSAGLTKVGPGTFVLGAANTYTGETVVEGGTLAVTGSAATSGKTYVGYANAGTSLSIMGGGSVTCLDSYLAVQPTSASNMVTVTGVGSSWTNTTDLVIGYGGASNALTASAGGSVATTNGFIGFDSAAGSNAVLITGVTSNWANSNVLYVGFDGDGNTFTVEDRGSALSSKDTVVGFNSASANNALRVKDSGSTFAVAGIFTLVIGDNGDANALEISNGGVVIGHNARLARNANSANNIATVTGPGSKWTNTGTIRVGALGPGNAVTVSAGGEASFSGNAFIGHGVAAANNSVTVADTGSTWTSATLTVGLSSTGNVLTVRDHGSVTAASGIAIAQDLGSEGTINIGAGGAPGTLSGPIAFGSGTGIINFNHSAAAYSFGGPITGPGAVRQIGSGTTILSGANTYSRGTTLSAGTLRLGAANALPSGGPLTFHGGTLDANNTSATLGELLLQATSTVRFGNGGAAQDIVFASAAAYAGGTLIIADYDGARDRLIITADPTGSGILDHIQFSGYPVGATWIAGTGEVVPRASLAAPAPTLSPLGMAMALTLLLAIGALSFARSHLDGNRESLVGHRRDRMHVVGARRRRARGRPEGGRRGT